MAILIFHYILLCSVSALCVGWFVLNSYKTGPHPPDSDDGHGGLGDAGLPIVVIPPGCTLKDLLVDRDPTQVRDSPLIHN